MRRLHVLIALFALVLQAAGDKATPVQSLVTVQPGILQTIAVFATLIAGFFLFVGLVLTDEGSESPSTKPHLWRTVQEAPATTESSSTGTAVADFSGKWLLSVIDGDVDRFMTDMGENAAFRRAARFAKYAVGQQIHVIEQKGDSFSCRCEFTGNVTQYTVGAGEQKAAELSQGKAISIVPSWGDSGMALTCVGWYEDDGRAIPRSKRFIHNGQMVTTLSSHQGTSIQRVYTRQSASPGALGAERPNFSGFWLQESHGGDPASYQKDMGVPLLIRSLSKLLSYSDGTYNTLVEHKDGCFRMYSPTGNRYAVTELRPGEQVTTQFPRSTLQLTGPCTWKPDGSLAFEGIVDGSGEPRKLSALSSGHERMQFTATSQNGHEFILHFKLVRPLLVRDDNVVVKANFSALWRMVDIRNLDRMGDALALHGVPKPKIAMIRRNNFFVGSMPLTIIQDGDVLCYGSGQYGVSYMRADGRTYDGLDIISSHHSKGGVMFKFDPEGIKLTHRVYLNKGGDFIDCTLELEDDKLLITQKLLDGEDVVRVFVRRKPEDDLDPAKCFSFDAATKKARGR